MNNILVLKDVCKTYHSGKTHQIKVLDGLNLAIKSGEVVGLLAPSGAGKSTLLHIAGLLDSPDSGQIFINGADYSALSDRRRTQARRGRCWVCLSISSFIARVLGFGKRGATAVGYGNGCGASTGAGVRFIKPSRRGGSRPSPPSRAVGGRATTGCFLPCFGERALGFYWRMSRRGI